MCGIIVCISVHLSARSWLASRSRAAAAGWPRSLATRPKYIPAQISHGPARVSATIWRWRSSAARQRPVSQSTVASMVTAEPMKARACTRVA